MLGVAFGAALLGSLFAPLVTGALNRMMEFEFPEITLPELPVEAVEEVRSLETKYPWVRMVENVYSALRAEVNMRQSGKFNKFINTNKL